MYPVRKRGLQISICGPTELSTGECGDVNKGYSRIPIAPTGRRVDIPLVIVVTFRGDKIHEEHIYWDQASVLVQTGLLTATSLTALGVDQAKVLRDPTAPLNRPPA